MGSGFQVQSSWFKVPGSRFQVQGFGDLRSETTDEKPEIGNPHMELFTRNLEPGTRNPIAS
jgi:hypothetical protein